MLFLQVSRPGEGPSPRQGRPRGTLPPEEVLAGRAEDHLRAEADYEEERRTGNRNRLEQVKNRSWWLGDPPGVCSVKLYPP